MRPEIKTTREIDLKVKMEILSKIDHCFNGLFRELRWVRNCVLPPTKMSNRSSATTFGNAKCQILSVCWVPTYSHPFAIEEFHLEFMEKNTIQ